MKKILLLVLMACFFGIHESMATEVRTEYVLLINGTFTDGSQGTLDDDVYAAAKWFYDNYASVDAGTGQHKGTIINISDLGNYTLNPAITKVTWIHLDGTHTTDLNTAYAYSDCFDAIKTTQLQTYLNGGGNLFLTNYATYMVQKLGRITADDGSNTVNGYVPFMCDGSTTQPGLRASLGSIDHRSHAIFAGLTPTQTNGNIFNMAPNNPEHNAIAWDFHYLKDDASVIYRVVDFEMKTNSIVLGTRNDVSDYACGGLVEFFPTKTCKGRIIANGMGCYEWNDGTTYSTNSYHSNVPLFTTNCLTYLTTEKTKKVAYLLPNNNNESVDADDEATALAWFKSEIVDQDKGVLIHPNDLANLDPTEFNTVWIHIDRDLTNSEVANWGDLGSNIGLYRPLIMRYAKNGGNLLLTKHAVQLVGTTQLNRCTVDPTVEAGAAIEGSSVGIKTSEDSWVINAVIGAGWTGSSYVRYKEAVNDVVEKYNVGTYWDHRADGLYFNLKTEINHPIGVTGVAAGEYYEVITICGPGVKEDHNVLWKFGDDTDDHITGFQNGQKCTVLGQWGHKSQLNNAAIVKFNPTTENSATDMGWEGSILCIGLGAYEWQPSNADGTARSGENPYINNIKQLTYNALNILDNTSETTVTVEATYGGVTYNLTKKGVQYYAQITSASSDLQVYDITRDNQITGNGHIANGQIEHDGNIYNITIVNENAFTNCSSLAFADLTTFHGFIRSDIRNAFPAWTLIYLPQEDVTISTKFSAYGENIINTNKAGDKVCDLLKVYDNEAGNPYVYHLFANKYEFTANAVEFNRSFSAYKSTICLPFAVSADETSNFGQFYAFDKVNGDDVRFAAVSSTEAYKPYMFEPSTNGTVISINAAKTIGTLDATPTFAENKYTLTTTLPQNWYGDATSKGGNFIGEFRPQEFSNAKSQGIYSYKSDGTFKTTTGTIYADPFRAYLKLNTPPTTAKVFRAVFEDFAPTGIFNANADDGADDGAYYTLQGIKVSNPGPGIYIHNKKKIIIKK